MSAAAGAVFGVLKFIFAIIIAGVLLSRSKGGYDVADSVAARLAGERGADLVSLATATVRSVTRGILGVALIQSLLAGLGFLVVGIPAAGLLAMICLFLAVIQIGPGLIIIPTVIYVFSTSDTLPAVLFLIWSIFVALLDNILKPLLVGQGRRCADGGHLHRSHRRIPDLGHPRLVRRDPFFWRWVTGSLMPGWIWDGSLFRRKTSPKSK